MRTALYTTPKFTTQPSSTPSSVIGPDTRSTIWNIARIASSRSSEAITCGRSSSARTTAGAAPGRISSSAPVSTSPSPSNRFSA